MSRDPLELAATCTRCALAHSRQRVVIGSGSYDARLVFVGEAPGASEDAGGAPFIGRSGQLLFTLVRDELKLGREECYVTNVVKCRPPNNRTPSAGELAACRGWWLQQRKILSAEVYVTLGNTATRAVLQTREPIGALRGRVQNLDGVAVVPTFHPAAALRGGAEVTELMRADLRVARDLLERVR